MVSSITAQGKQQKLCGVAVNSSEIKRGKNALWATTMLVLDDLTGLFHF